jgi:hypothetical protein
MNKFIIVNSALLPFLLAIVPLPVSYYIHSSSFWLVRNP